MKGIARKHIFGIKPYVPGKPIDELKREMGLNEAIKLASNENAFGPSPKAVRAAKKSLGTINRYPDGGCFYLKRALAKELKVKMGNIVLGNGSDEIIILAMRAFVEKGDEVIIAKPTFLVYEIASKVQGAKIKFAPLKDFRYDVRKIAKLVSKKTKIVFIANPDNPTGTYITKKEVAYLVSHLPRKAVIFFDEAYFEFAEGTWDYPDTMKLLKSRHVIIARTFSKAYSLAGLRVGYAITSEKIADLLNRVREPFNVNSVAQSAALAALGDKKYAKKTLGLIKESKAFICRELEQLGIEYIPSVTNFILFRVGRNSKAIYKKLLKKGMIVREMSVWKLDNYIRVTAGTMSESKRFIRALKEVL